MAINKKSLEILICPESKQPLAMAPDDLLARVNEAIREGRITTRDGTPVTEELREGLVDQGGAYLYLVRDSIPVMLVGESIALDQLSQS